MTKEYTLGNSTWYMKNINIDIADNTFCVITGISGAGKSTLMHIIAGLDQPDSGDIYLDNENIGVMNDRQLSIYRNKKIGFVFQNFYLYPDINLIENVSLPLLVAGINRPERERKALDALEKVGLSGFRDHSITQISGGQRQRVAIARSIVNTPRILIADEPTGNLDSKTGKNILDLFLYLKKIHKMTLIIVTHDEYMAKKADREIVVHDGQIITDTTN